LASGDSTDPLYSFVPRWLASSPALLAAHPPIPAIVPLPSAAVFADISGFSRLTQLFADQGADGIERLTRIIGDFLGQLLDTVAAWGGEVEDLYGDGILAFWPAESTGEPPVARALGCAAALVARFDGFDVAPGVTLRLRAATVAGDCFALQLGGVSEHWLFLLAGDCLSALGPLLDGAQSGEVALGPAVRGLLAGIPAFVPARELAAALRPTDTQPSASLPSRQPRVDPAYARRFLPRPLRNRSLVEAGWLAEFRAVTIFCAGFPALRCDGTDSLPVLQQTVATVQRIVEEHDGAVMRCSMSEKGPMVMTAFGVPDCAHADDPSRALLTALEVAQTSIAFGGRCTVTTGTAFCGVVGNAVRRAFTPAGAAVNRAAKLLTISGLPAVVCDEATARAADHRVDMRPLARSSQVGQERVLLFEPAIALRAGSASTLAATIGRDREVATLLRRIDALTGSERRGGIATIEGEAGIGKSELVEHVLQRLAGQALVLRCAADPMTGATPLATLSPLFAILFSPELAEGRDAVAGAIGEALRRRGMDSGHATLAGPVLPIARFPESAAVSRDLSPEDAARVQREVLLALLNERIGECCAVVLIEDAHWLDSASWVLLNRAAHELPRVLFLLTARPPTDAQWQGFEVVLDVTPVERLRLLPLGDAEMDAVVSHTLSCTQVERRVLAAIMERARGSPLFAAQLALGLRDRGLLIIEHGTCLLDATAGEGVLQELPDTLQRTIVARFDRLSEPLQLTLKVASVFGRPFSAEALRQATPLSTLQEAQPSILGNLVRAGLLRAAAGEITEAAGNYDFAQPVARDAVYGLLSFAQRRDLHSRVARYLELKPEGISAPEALLGHHWARAGESERAMRCWEHAGVAALEGGAYREAARAYTEAVQAAELLRTRGLSAREIARLRQNLGEALLHSGDLARSQTELQDALTLLGRPFARGQPRAAAALGRQSAALAWREALGPRAIPWQSDAAVGRHRQLARLYENLGQVLAHTSDVVGMATCVVASLNAAQRSGDDAAYSRAAGLLALAFLLVGWPSLADRYYAHACRTRPSSDRPHDQLMTAEYIAIYLLAAARLREAEVELRNMMALATASGNQRRGLDAASLLTLCLMEAGRADECAPLQSTLAATADQYGDPQLRCWVALEQAQLAFADGPDGESERHLAMAERLLPRLGIHEAVWTFGLFAALRAMQGRQAEAVGFARRVIDLADRRKIAVYAQHGVFGAAAVSLDALERARGSELRLRSAETRAAMRVLGDFSLRMPMTRPRGLSLLGRYAQLCGKRRQAARLSARAAAEAAAQRRPYQLAVAFPWSSTNPSRR
jgi:class 3 adenylate cyclase/tetratricopeptide (TPR) repeat protein